MTGKGVPAVTGADNGQQTLTQDAPDTLQNHSLRAINPRDQMKAIVARLETRSS
jgi:hypothetical protein